MQNPVQKMFLYKSTGITQQLLEPFWNNKQIISLSCWIILIEQRKWFQFRQNQVRLDFSYKKNLSITTLQKKAMTIITSAQWSFHWLDLLTWTPPCSYSLHFSPNHKQDSEKDPSSLVNTLESETFLKFVLSLKLLFKLVIPLIGIFNKRLGNPNFPY